MSRTTLTYLESEADERDFNGWQVNMMRVTGAVTFEGAFVVLHDKKKGEKKYYPANRILQIDQEFTEVERVEVHANHKTKPLAVVYYLRCDVDLETLYLSKKRQFGDRPFGLECRLIDKKQFFWLLLTPDFKKLVTVPINRIIGGDQALG